MAKNREVPRPTEGELELLGILWSNGAATVREIFEAVNAKRPVVYTGVLKLLQIMTEKGLVERDERDRAHIYRPAVSRKILRSDSFVNLASASLPGARVNWLCERWKWNRPVIRSWKPFGDSSERETPADRFCKPPLPGKALCEKFSNRERS